MTLGNPYLALAPAIGLIIYSTVHLAVSRWRGSRNPYQCLLIGSLLGLLVMMAVTAFGLAHLQTSKADVWCLGSVNLVTYLALGYGYFNFINLNVASLRVRFLQEMLHAANGLTKAELLGRYEVDEMVVRRIERLTKSKQIIEKDGRYYQGNSCFLLLAQGFDFLRLVVLGTRSITDSHRRQACERWENRLAEISRLAILGLATLYVYSPFLTDKFMGAGDAKDYSLLLNDFILQVKNGEFPVYVSQSNYCWIGVPIIQRPYYYYLGGLIHLMTGGSLDRVLVQHLTIIVSALAAACVMYATLLMLWPPCRWTALCLSFLYVASPGLLALPYVMDMYPSFMTAPFIPLLFYGMVRASEKHDTTSATVIAVALALLWMAHAPIALWCTTLCAIFASVQLLLVRKFKAWLRCWTLTVFMFGLLASWYFVSVYSIGCSANCDLQEAGIYPGPPWSGISSRFTEIVCVVLKGSYPGAILPVADPPNTLTDLQLGYSLYIVAVITILVSLFTHGLQLKWFAMSIVGLLCYLVPITGMIEFLWNHLPKIFEITYFWPQQRLYIIIAAMICIAAILALRVLAEVRYVRPTYYILLICLCTWSMTEVAKFHHRGYMIQDARRPALVNLTENAWLAGYAPRPGERRYEHTGYYDPVLENRLISTVESEKTVLVSNKAHASEENSLSSCRLGQDPLKLHTSLPCCINHGPAIVPLGSFDVNPGDHFILALGVTTKCHKVIYLIQGNDFERVGTLANNIRGHQTIDIPIWNSSEKIRTLTTSLVIEKNGMDEVDQVSVQSMQLFPYKSSALPLCIESLVPYQLTVDAPAACILETHKHYYPGYMAWVNGCSVSPIQSTDGMTAIPLGPGLNKVEMRYVGTIAMRWSFITCGASWLTILAIAAIRGIRRRCRWMNRYSALLSLFPLDHKKRDRCFSRRIRSTTAIECR